MSYWRTREGYVIQICEMQNSHLMNTIRYLQRHASRYAQMDFYGRVRIFEKYKDLFEEAVKRGLIESNEYKRIGSEIGTTFDAGASRIRI